MAHENRILRTLHKRQDNALAKYESTNAELPQLLHSHAEELRVWQTKYRNLQAQFKELESKLKQKEMHILTLSDQNKFYNQLNKDKYVIITSIKYLLILKINYRNLEERQRLTEKVHQLEQRVMEKENDLKMMARKMQIEAKTYKQNLQNEQRKTKDIMLRYEKARLELSGYYKLEEMHVSFVHHVNFHSQELDRL